MEKEKGSFLETVLKKEQKNFGNMQDLVPIMQDLEMFAVQRHERNLEILARLRADGYDIEFEELKLGQSNTQITRAHFATVLMQKAYVSSRKAAFDSILADGSKYIPHKKKYTCGNLPFFPQAWTLFFSGTSLPVRFFPRRAGRTAPLSAAGGHAGSGGLPQHPSSRRSKSLAAACRQIGTFLHRRL